MRFSEAEIDKLLTDLSGKNAVQREKAKRFYNQNKAEILPYVLSQWDGRQAKSKRNRNTLQRMTVLCSLFYLVMLPFFFWKDAPTAFVLFCLVLPLLLLLSICWCKAIMRGATLTAKSASILRIIAGLDEPRYIGNMIDIMIESNTHALAIIEPVFYRQLRLLEPSHASLLNRRHHGFLYDHLCKYAVQSEKTFDEEKALAILTAYKSFAKNDESLLVAKVKRVGLSESVRVAADECMQHLIARAEAESSQTTLLRASESAGGQEELLRAANSNTATQAETLLRVLKE